MCKYVCSVRSYVQVCMGVLRTITEIIINNPHINVQYVSQSVATSMKEILCRQN
jgi:predicted Fe-S protein YdhL (DUF1289 family)